MIIDIEHIGKLANLHISAEEKTKFEKQLSAILEHFKKLSEKATKDVNETNQITGLTNITRSDEITSSLSQNEALKNTKNIHNGMFVVPIILEGAIGE